MSFMILVLGTVYLGWRVYIKKKYFTTDWMKPNKDGSPKYGLQLMERKEDDADDNDMELAAPKKQGVKNSDIQDPAEIEL